MSLDITIFRTQEGLWAARGASRGFEWVDIGSVTAEAATQAVVRAWVGAQERAERARVTHGRQRHQEPAS